MSRTRKVAVLVAQVAAIAAVLLAWQHDSSAQASYLSKPSLIWSALKTWLRDSTLRSYIPVTLTEAFLGLVLGLALAVVAASVMASSKSVAAVLDPFVAVANAVPRVALAPLFLLVFGIGLNSKVLFIASAVVFFPFYSIYRALTTIEPELLDSTRCLGAGRGWAVVDVYVPSILSSLLTSLRVAVTFALLTAVLAEFLSAQSGIGYAIQQSQTNLQPDYAIAGIVILGVIAFIIDRGLVLLEGHLLRWRGAAS